MKLYGALIMDIVGSKKFENRGALQEKLNGYIDMMNEKYAEILPSPIAITVGDEWQMITTNPSMCYDLIHEFQQLLWKDNVEFYAGIGIGDLNTNIVSNIGWMDGPCFHMAREAINIAKDGSVGKNKRIYSNNNRIFFKRVTYMSNNGYETGKDEAWQEVAATSENITNLDNEQPFKKTKVKFNEAIQLKKIITELPLSSLINTLIENTEILKAHMTPRQKEVYIEYSKLGTYSKVIEAREGNSKESKSGISQKLRSAEYFAIKHNHEIIKDLLDYCCKLMEVGYDFSIL